MKAPKKPPISNSKILYLGICLNLFQLRFWALESPNPWEANSEKLGCATFGLVAASAVWSQGTGATKPQMVWFPLLFYFGLLQFGAMARNFTYLTKKLSFIASHEVLLLCACSSIPPNQVLCHVPALKFRFFAMKRGNFPLTLNVKVHH